MAQDDKGQTKTFSRRNLLFGFMNRGRGPQEEGQRLATFEAGEVEADRLAAAGDMPAAVAAYRDILKEHPDMADVRFKLGRCLYMQGRLVQARVELLRLVREDSVGGVASLFLGLCHLRENHLDRGMDALKGYFNPDQPQLMREINLIRANVETGNPPDPQDAALAIEDVLKLRRPA